ncbi:MAG TPA: single-stranded-DNA-specific exonuclease RecJ [Candidatus Deferrimicrobiaceae bacterium]|nr:single-stranded-DNA-specific exonuclease RecJ [Candidatus Deferrimicrobiaceae bacterium]
MAGAAGRTWLLRSPDDLLVREIRETTGLSETASRILVNRGITDPREAVRFLNGTLRDLSSPFRMKDLEEASRRLVDAARRREPILVYADYDADGATGAACLYLFLTERFPDANVRIHQNHRVVDGYGLKKDHLDDAARAGVKLVVTVDCGITDVEAIRHASAAGMDVIVTDHHVPGEVVPPALAVLNPKQKDCPYPEKDLAGVGVVFLLMCGIRRLLREECAFPEGEEPGLRKYLDLVALGTVADMAPLRGDNRLFVKAGLEEIRQRARPGIRALLSVSGIAPENVNEIDLGFRIGPRLNAAGRVGDSTRSSALLVTDRFERALRIAAELHTDNARRQREEERILRSATAAVEAGPPVSSLGAVVLADPSWHLGILGIVSAKIAERYHRPTVLLRIEGEEATGSVRSAGGFPLIDALAGLSHLLTRYGGHMQAAGVSLPAGNLCAFREGLDRAARAFASGREGVPRVQVDAGIRFGEINHRLMEELDRLRPFGVGNEEPVLIVRDVRLERYSLFGEGGNHLKAELSGDARRFEAVAFHRTHLPEGPGGFLDILFTPQWTFFRGDRSLRLRLIDARPSERPGARAASGS